MYFFLILEYNITLVHLRWPIFKSCLFLTV